MGSEPRVTYSEIEPEEKRFVELLQELFTQHGEALVFGPHLAGASYEIKIDGRPQVNYQKGCLTVMWGHGAHFHLQIGDPAGGEPNAVRRGAFFEMEGSCVPKSWGLRFWNGAGEELLSIYFPNAYLAGEGRAEAPDWSKLKLWQDFRARYAGAPR